MSCVLIIDNNVDFYPLLLKKLDPLNATVFFADCLEDALRIIKREEVDFISVSDILIDTSGDSIRKQLIDSGYRGPIILLSSNPYRNEKYVVDKCLSTKDFIEEIQEAVNNYYYECY
jgi:hypothetical protein